MKTQIKILTVFCIGILTHTAHAQEFKIDADVRIRYEYRDGYAQPKPDTVKPADFVVQRTRLNFRYKTNNLELMISPQNVRIWGESPSGAKADINGLQMHQAWIGYNVSPELSVRAGRQELDYDDARILGNADWNMQARSHDALIFRLTPVKSHQLHAGIAMNARSESIFRENYDVPNQYKSMQYLWYSGNLKNLHYNFLFLNQGLEFTNAGIRQTAWNQNTGVKGIYKGKTIDVEASAYLQTGHLQNDPLNAHMFTGKIIGKNSIKWRPEAGFAYLSGKNQNDTRNIRKSFNPWYGTNHKFNGYMDYFYVGNHLNSSGLTDVFAQIMYTSGKLKCMTAAHYFASAAELIREQKTLNKYLGTEVDFTASYTVLPDLTLNFGYSRIWVTESMLHLKGGDNLQNQWIFVAIHCQPELINNKR